MKTQMYRKRWTLLFAGLFCFSVMPAFADSLPLQPQNRPVGRDWKIYISNEVCDDYTWGLTEEQTRDATAELIRAHLDLMTATDDEPWELQNRYTCTVTNEALFFLEKYPEREDELARRVRQGRFQLSPFLCNTNWGFPGVEGFLRSLYPAKRLAAKWNVPLQHAVHSELPSFPWGVVPLLTGSGIRWCAKPYYDYDAHFEKLTNPPLFEYEGPDGSRLRAVLDPWTSQNFTYAQGAGILKRVWHKDNPTTVEGFWLPHFNSLENYPLDIILAQGTHGDIALDSRLEAQIVHDGMVNFNHNPDKPAMLAHATFQMFTDAVDSVQNASPFLQTVRGEFGHTWELWPVSLAKYAAQTREGERKLVSAEALLAATRASLKDEKLGELHRSAEWHLAMLLDHAWNGSDEANKKLNAALRKKWAEQLLQQTDALERNGWKKLGLPNEAAAITVFNPTSVPRRDVVSVPWDRPGLPKIFSKRKNIPAQICTDHGEKRLVFVSDDLPGFAFARYKIEETKNEAQPHEEKTTIESPYFRISTDASHDWLPEIFHRGSNQPLTDEHGFLQLLYRAGQDERPRFTAARVTEDGAVLSTVEIDGRLPHTEFTLALTVYQQIDRLDVTIYLKKQPVAEQEALFLAFGKQADDLRIETCGAVVRPYPQPRGDLLPGADPTRMVVQGFAAGKTANGLNLLVTPLDAFCLRLDVAPLAFELVGNDQNYQEVAHDQNGETEFVFRFSLQVSQKPFDAAAAFAFSRRVMMPLLAVNGAPTAKLPKPVVTIDPRAIATTLKPADPQFGDGMILRLWETGGSSEPVVLGVPAGVKVISCNLLEQDIQKVAVKKKEAQIPLRARGFVGVRLR